MSGTRAAGDENTPNGAWTHTCPDPPTRRCEKRRGVGQRCHRRDTSSRLSQKNPTKLATACCARFTCLVMTYSYFPQSEAIKTWLRKALKAKTKTISYMLMFAVHQYSKCMYNVFVPTSTGVISVGYPTETFDISFDKKKYYRTEKGSVFR